MAAAPASAQAAPELPNTIWIVVPFTPGGSIGSNDVARTKPDDAALLLSSSLLLTTQLTKWTKVAKERDISLNEGPNDRH